MESKDFQAIMDCKVLDKNGMGMLKKVIKVNLDDTKD